MKHFQINPALYHYLDSSELKELSGSYIDNILRCGSDELRTRSKIVSTRIEMAEEFKVPSEFTEFVIDTGKDGDFVTGQNAYLRKLEYLPPKTSFKHFRSLRMKLEWLAMSRPYCSLKIL